MGKHIEPYTHYSINDIGQLRNDHTGKILKPFIHNKGYYAYKLRDKTIFLHREVAKAFIDNPGNLPVVNHKDENKLNNAVSNLEWCELRYNSTYGTTPERIKQLLYEKKLTRPVMVDKTKFFRSVSEAARFLKSDRSYLIQCLKNGKTCKNHVVEYGDGPINENRKQNDI